MDETDETPEQTMDRAKREGRECNCYAATVLPWQQVRHGVGCPLSEPRMRSLPGNRRAYDHIIALDDGGYVVRMNSDVIRFTIVNDINQASRWETNAEANSFAVDNGFGDEITIESVYRKDD